MEQVTSALAGARLWRLVVEITPRYCRDGVEAAAVGHFVGALC